MAAIHRFDDVVAPASEARDFGSAGECVRLADKAFDQFAGIQCDGADAERTGDLGHETAELVFRHRPNLHFNARSLELVVACQAWFGWLSTRQRIEPVTGCCAAGLFQARAALGRWTLHGLAREM